MIANKKTCGNPSFRCFFTVLLLLTVLPIVLEAHQHLRGGGQLVARLLDEDFGVSEGGSGLEGGDIGNGDDDGSRLERVGVILVVTCTVLVTVSMLCCLTQPKEILCFRCRAVGGAGLSVSEE